MKIIVLQHIKIEDPGYIKDLMLNDNVDLKTIELDEGETIPKDLSIYDAMFCMGGPMDTWMEKDYPWLIEEKKRIKEFVVDLKKQMKVSKFIDLVEYPCCDALSYCQVAEGKLDVVAQSSNKIWDIHPLISIIESAGGVVTTWKNKNASKGGNILASANKTIHNKILKLLKSEFK